MTLNRTGRADEARALPGIIEVLAMNLHRLDLVSLSLFVLVVRTGSISQG